MLQVVAALIVTGILSGALGLILAGPEVLILGVIDMITAGQGQLEMSGWGKAGMILFMLGGLVTFGAMIALLAIAF